MTERSELHQHGAFFAAQHGAFFAAQRRSGYWRPSNTAAVDPSKTPEMRQ